MADETAADRLLKLEAAIIAASAGDWLASIDELKLLLIADDPSLGKKALALAAPKISEAALAGMLEALGFGVDEALAEMGLSGKKAKKLRAKMLEAGVDPALTSEVARLDKEAKKALAQTAKLITAGVALDVALTPLFANRTSTKRTLVSAIHETANDGTTSAAVAQGYPLVWESERDACVHCLAYAGLVSKDGTFKEGLTYGKAPLKKWRKGGVKCPLHPECRCRLAVLRSQEYADALRREADRSVLRGFSLPSESEKARIEAADRLLKRGVEAPKSVRQFALDAVKEGKFPTRSVPKYTGPR